MATPLSLVFELLAIDRASAVFQRVGAAASLAGAESERGMARVSGAIAGISKGLTLAGVAAAVVSVKMAADFQSSMRLIQTQAGASKAEVDSMSASVLKLAGDVGFAPTKLAESLYHIESVGLRGAQALEVLRLSAEGAKVGHSDLEQTTNALTAAVASGMKGTQNYSDAMGALNTIVGIGDMRMEDLNDAMSTGVLVTMKQYGVTLSDVGAALATFGDNNMRGQLAATSLRMAVQAISKPAKSAQADLETIGLSVKNLQDDLQKGGLNKALNDLHDHLVAAGKDGTEAGQFLTDAFGKRAGAGLQILNGQMDRFNTKYGEMTSQNGHFDDAWKATQDNFQVQVDRMKATIESFAISMGTKMLPAVTGLFRYLADHKQVLADIAYAIGTTLVLAVGAFTLSLLANPVVIFGTAIAAIGVAAVDAYNNFKPFRDMVDGFASNVVGKFNAAKDAVSGFYAGLTGKTLDPLPAGTNRSLDAKLQTSSGGQPTTAGAAGAAGAGVAEFFRKDVTPALLDFWKTLHDRVLPAVGSFVGKVREVADKYGPPLADFLRKVLVPALKDLGDFVTKSVWPSVKALADVFGPILMPVLGALAAALTVVLASAFYTIATIMKNVVGPAIMILAGFFIKLAAIIGEVVDGILVTIKFLGDGILSGVSTILRAMGLIDPAFKGAADKVDGWKDAFDGSMHDAIASTNSFVDSANAKLDELLHPRTIQINAYLNSFANIADYQAAGNSGNKSQAGKLGALSRAAGGAVFGAGTGTSDSIPAWLSNGEHVWTAAEVQKAGGHGAVESMRRAVRGFAVGGPVLAVDYPNPGPWAQGVSSKADAAIASYMPQLMASARASQAAAMASYGGTPGAAGGAARWAPIILQVLALLGQPATLLAGIESLINKESGGNPNAINLTDSNARAGHPSQGLMQTIPGTFYAYAGPFANRGITDPLANIYAGVNYALHRYGPGMLAAGGRHSSSGGYVGYERGTGYVPVTGPAILHEGERVVPKNQNVRGGSSGTAVVVHLLDVNNVLIGTMDGRIADADSAYATAMNHA